MCGLVGFLSFERPFPRERGERIVRDMAASLDYRGPDMDGYWSSANERCHLGHKRLAVIDLTEAGRQPMLDDTGRYVIVFNGEIYNFQALRDRLAGAGVTFRSKSDTEVLLKGYIAFGNAWFAQLDGQFALAIYDTHARTMVLARDRAGENRSTIAHETACSCSPPNCTPSPRCRTSHGRCRPPRSRSICSIAMCRRRIPSWRASTS